MLPAPIPAFESARLDAIDRLGLLSRSSWPGLDLIVKEAADRYRLPMATVTIVDADRAHFIARYGVSDTSTERESSICGHALLAEDLLILEDTTKDPRFADNPIVVNAPHLRFYAGAAIRDRVTRLPIGVFCVRGVAPRRFSPDDIAALLAYAQRAERLVNGESAQGSAE